jgi:hypothetical protein
MWLNFVIQNKESIGIVVGFITVITPYIMFVLSKRKEQEQLYFQRFHETLMRGLSNRRGELGLDQQVAILFELRNYPKYYSVIKRLLKFQINRWTKMLKEKPHFKMLITEAEETINIIDKNWFQRHIVEKIKPSS